MLDDDEIINISDSDDDNDHGDNDAPVELTRRDILAPAITRIVDALGSFEGSPPTYRLGDSLIRSQKTMA
jgi:replication fork protection complex subunit Tof1/Swi1